MDTQNETNSIMPLKEKDNVDVLLDERKTFDEIIGGYHSSYKCEEFEPEDMQGKELW